MKNSQRLLWLAIFLLIGSCTEAPTANDIGLKSDIWVPTLISVEKTKKGSYNLNWLIPVYDAQVKGNWEGRGWRFRGDNSKPNPLPNDPRQNVYELKIEKIVNGNYLLKLGSYTMNYSDGEVKWAFDQSTRFKNKQVNQYYIEADGQGYFGFNLTDGSVAPIDQANLAKLEAIINVTSQNVKINEVVTFDGSLSVAGDNFAKKITKYLWQFGDGTVKEGALVNHIYKNKGAYTAQLTIYAKNYEGQTDSATATAEIIVRQPDFTETGKLIYTDNLLKVYYNKESDKAYLYILADLSLTQGRQGKPAFSGNFDGENKAWVLRDGQILNNDNRWIYIKLKINGKKKIEFNYFAYYDDWHYDNKGWIVVNGANYNHLSLAQGQSYNGRHLSLYFIDNLFEKAGF